MCKDSEIVAKNSTRKSLFIENYQHNHEYFADVNSAGKLPIVS